MDETQEKCVVESESNKKKGNAIDQLDLLHRLFIDHGDYGGSSPAPRIRNDLLVVWRGMEDPPPSEQADYLPEVQLQHIPASRSMYCGSRLKTPLVSLRLPQRPAGLPVLTSQSALRLSITRSRWVSSSQRSRENAPRDRLQPYTRRTL